MSHPELLTNKVPRAPGVPSKHWLKGASAVLLMVVLLAMYFSYQEEPLKTGDDLARQSASTLNSVERSRVDQNHQLIEDAFKASGLPTELIRAPNAAEPNATPLGFSNASSESGPKTQDQGIMKSAGMHSGPLPSVNWREASALGVPGLPSTGVGRPTPEGINSVTLAQESEVMNSKIVIVDFEEANHQRTTLKRSEMDRLDPSDRPDGLDQWEPASSSTPSSLSALGQRKKRLKSLNASLEELDPSSPVKAKSSALTPTQTANGTSESAAYLEALTQALGRDNEKSATQSVRSPDNEFFRELKSNAQSKPSLKPNALESEHSILEGTVIPAVLMRDINSDLPGTITAQVTQTVYDSVALKTPLICKGAKLIGRYSNDVRTGQSRLLFAFTRLILLSGQSFNLTGFDGADALGQAGVAGEVDNHFLKIYGSSLAIGALSDQITRQQVVPQGAFASSSATGQIMVQTTREMLQRGRDLAPTITVGRGALINVEVRQDLVFTGGEKISCT